MDIKIVNFILMLSACVLLVVQPSMTSPLENEALIELTQRVVKLQTKVEFLEIEKVELKERFDTMQSTMQAKIEKLTARIDDLEKQAENESKITNLESPFAPKWASNYATNQSFNKNDGSTPRATTPPSSCEELTGYANFPGMDGIQLIQNKVTKKIEAVFCQFSTNPVSQDLIGHVDVKTMNVHFYVQRNSSFRTDNAVIPFDVAPINEGDAFNLPLGIFTVPVPGIYHFDLSALKDPSSTFLHIRLQVNGVNVGNAYTQQSPTGSYNVVSLSASLRLEEGNTVNLFNSGFGIDDGNYHYTHFTGWLVEEDLV